MTRTAPTSPAAAPTVKAAGLADALDRWRDAVGPDHVVTAPATLDAVSTATFATHQRVPAVVRPGSVPEVQACLRIANATRTPVYPISTGKNWGSGSAVPYGDGSVLLDLGRLDHVRAIDSTRGVATVEAGVTQRQLQDRLLADGSRFFLPCTSSSPDTSIVGNVMERGQVRGPVYDRAASTCAYEVVLPTGELVHTGFGAFPGATAAPHYRWGVGPHLDGLFTQSGLGVVTALSVWLQPVPASFLTFFFKLHDDSRLAETVNALRDLLQGSSIRAVASISNPMGVISFVHGYPWQEAAGRTPLPPELERDLMKKSKLSRWNGLGVLFSESEQTGRAQVRLIARALKGRADFFTYLDRRRASLYRLVRRPWNRLLGADLQEFLDFAYYRSPALGHLDEHGAIRMTYWRKREKAPIDPDPDRDRCGFVNTVVIVPNEGREVEAAFRLIEERVRSAGFEPNYGVRCGTDRNLEITSFITYDREIQGDDERAMECHRELLGRLIDAGYMPCRLGLQSTGLLPRPTDDTPELHRRLKAALDPNGVLAPGRYDLGSPDAYRRLPEGE